MVALFPSFVVALGSFVNTSIAIGLSSSARISKLESIDFDSIDLEKIVEVEKLQIVVDSSTWTGRK